MFVPKTSSVRSNSDRSISDRDSADYWEDDYTSLYLEPQDYSYQVHLHPVFT